MGIIICYTAKARDVLILCDTGGSEAWCAVSWSGNSLMSTPFASHTFIRSQPSSRRVAVDALDGRVLLSKA